MPSTEPVNEKPTILIVEDDQMLRAVLQLALGTMGLECTVVGDGAEGLARMCGHNYSLVLTDMRMPVMSGLEMIRAARQQQSEQPPIILLSGYHDHADAELHGAGISRILRKPVGLEELCSQVLELLGLAGSQQGSPCA